MFSGSILAAVLVLALVIFIHELGHFLVGKWCNVEIKTFSMGFGPTLFSRKIGETVYRLAAIPLGGYVRMAGTDDEIVDNDDTPSDPSRGFTAKPLWQRAAIVAAGPAVNLLFAIVILTGCALAYGVAVPSDKAVVDGVATGKPAAAAGLLAGDTVVSVAGKTIGNWDEMVAQIQSSEGRTLRFDVTGKDGVARSVEVTPVMAEQRDPFGEVVSKVWQVGISRGIDFVPIGIGGALTSATMRTWNDSTMIVVTVGRLIQGRVSAGDLGGPILVVSEASKHADAGLQPLLLFMALISINLGVVNLLPIPVLDGGHLLFMGVEAIRGRPLSLRVREYALGVGMVLIGALMIFVIFHDLVRVVGG